MAARLQVLQARARPWLRPGARPRVARAPARRALARIPSAYAFDYEFARAQHGLGCRAATRVVVPNDPQERLDGLGARARKVRRYPGLKEEYYLAGFAPDPVVLDELGLDRGRVLVVVRPPPEMSLYHRHGNPLVAEVPRTAPGRSRGARGRPPAYGRAASRRAARAGVARGPWARDRRAQPRSARGSRRLGRRR